MKSGILAIMFLFVLSAPSLSQCYPFWEWDDGSDPSTLRWASNSVDFLGSNSPSDWIWVFRTWTDQINYVSANDYEIFWSSGAINLVDDWGYLCNLGELACTTVYLEGTAGSRITGFAIHMNYTGADWTNKHFPSVQMHEAGHAVGMWHAKYVCPYCQGDDLPTMMPCSGYDLCYGCGNTTNQPLAYTLSPADIHELHSKYDSAVVSIDDPGEIEEHVAPPAAHGWGISSYPNPFNPATTITVDVLKPTSYTFRIVDVRGKRIYETQGVADVGPREFYWNGRTKEGATAPAGIYNAVFESEERVLNHKVTLLK